LYASGDAIPPYYSYSHYGVVVPGDSCPYGGSSVTGGAFYPTSGGNYPAKYQGSLFFADYTRRCIWVMLKGTNGLPDPKKIEKFAVGTSGAYSPVDLVSGPGGDLFYVDLVGGTIRRISYYPANRPPVAVLDADHTYGGTPLTVNFDASRSTDADADPLTYSWDLNGDGVFGDSTAVNPSYTYNTRGAVTVSLRVSDPYNALSTATVKIWPGDLGTKGGLLTDEHARVLREAGKMEVEDLGSSNGTYVNGQKIGQRASPCSRNAACPATAVRPA